MDRSGGGKSQRHGGAAGAHSAHKAGGGGPWPRPCFGFVVWGPCGPPDHKTPPPPGGPAAVARAYGKAGALRWGGGVWRPEGRPCGPPPRPAKQKSGARSLWPRAPPFQGASRPAAAPPRRAPSASHPPASAPPSALRWLLMGSRKVRALRWGRLFSVADRLRPNQKDGLSSYL